MTYHTLRTQAHRVSLFAVVLLILLALSGSHASQAAEPTQLSFPIKINFQDSSAPVYLDYRTDGGEVYQDHGNGYTYGWSQDVSNGTHNSDDPISPNEAYDTYVRMTDLWKGIDATWEIALADGWYDVRLVVGKAGNNFSYYDVEIEGERVVSGQPYPHLNSYWLETTTAIEVTDGRLTISNGPENKFNHINFIEIDQRSTPSPDQTQPVKINFQPLGSEIVDGYFADTGMNYGTRSNGYTYGWSVNNSMYAYDHDLPQSPNQLLDTHIHMQRLQVEDYWEIELPNGNYHVRLVAGDYKPDNWGYYRFDVEDVRLIHSNGWINGQVIDQEGVIEVADGRLTVKKGEGASNNRISFIEITPILPEVDPIVSVGNADFVETFSSAPTFPQVWSSANWDWTVQVGNNPTQMGAMAADYNIGCLNPDIIDTINRLDETVYSCDGRLLTAVNGESLGIGSNYGAAYLTPNRIIDPSQDFTVQFDLSTVRTNPHGDWVEIWLMPYGTHLMSPIDFATVGQGLPQEGLRFKLNNQNGWSVALVDNFAETDLTLNSYATVPTASNEELTTFQLTVIGNTMKFGLPEQDLWWYQGNVPESMKNWGETIVSFGHHSYLPQSNCGDSDCGPNTWHWDNVIVSPSEPFAIIQPDKTVVVASDSDHTFNFETSAPDDDSYLRFMAIGDDIEISFNNGLTWVEPTLQLTQETQESNNFRYYWTPIPRNVIDVKVRGENWTYGEWAVREMSIWSQTYLTAGSQNWQAESGQSGSFFGQHTTGVGDVNGDGYDDVLVGAPRYISNGVIDAGRVELYMGSADGLELEPRWVLDGATQGGQFGYTVASAGDVNNDSYADILISAPAPTANKAGKVYLYYGAPSGLDLTPVTLSDDDLSSDFGLSLASLGDLNGDGFADFAIGSPGYDDPTIGENTGRISIYFGDSAGVDAAQVAQTLVGEAPHSYFGSAISMIGDANDTTVPELAVSAGRFGLVDAQDENGRVYVYYDFAGGQPTADWIVTGVQATEKLGDGYGLDGAGDVNGDSFADLIIGATGYTENEAAEGRILVYYGGENGLGDSERLPDFQVNGQQADSGFGYSVAGLGDVNGDGVDDIGVGSYQFDQIDTADLGLVAVFFGNTAGLTTTPDWMGTPYATTSDTRFGFVVNGAGDIDNDGYSDFVIGEPQYSNVEQREGRVVVVPGAVFDTQGQLTSPLEKFQALATSFATSHHTPEIGYLGYPVTHTIRVTNTDLVPATAAELNVSLPAGSTYVGGGDSFDGSTISWQLAGLDPGEGAFVEFVMQSDTTMDESMYSLIIDNATLGVTSYPLSGVPLVETSLTWEDSENQNQAQFGYNTASAGDVNGDGFDDILVGSFLYDVPETTLANAGRVALYYGSPYGLETEPRWEATGSETGGWFGFSVSGAGDLNNDGYADVIIGQRQETDSGRYARIYIYYGAEDGLGDSPTIINDGQVNSNFGHAVAPAGDIDQDGFDDVLIGAPNYDDAIIGVDTGRIYVYYGSSSGLDLTRTPWIATGDQANSDFGHSLDAAGDIDGNGYIDIVASAFGYSVGDLTWAGKAYVFYNSETGLSDTADWTFTSAQNQEQLGAGFGVAGAGDVNADGYDDILIGGQNYTGDQIDEGRVMAFYGSDNGLGVSERLPDWQIEGHMENASLGWSVAGLGDVNGDGVDDIGVGGDTYSQDGNSGAGRVAIFFGSNAGLGHTADWNMTRDADQDDNRFGHRIISAADVNGDGQQDVLVGEPRYGESGRVTAYLGTEIASTPAVVRSIEIGRQSPATSYTDREIQYTFNVRNSDLVTATNIVVTATLPSDAIYLAGGSYDGTIISWVIDKLGPGETGSVNLSVTASQPTTLTGGMYTAVVSTTLGLVEDRVDEGADTVLVLAPDGWRLLDTDNSPAVWGEYGLAYEYATDTILLYGGNVDGWDYENSTWRFDGTDWTEVTTTQTPPMVYGLAMTSLDFGALLFGGYDPYHEAYGETWAFGTDWAGSAGVINPPPRGGAAIATDVADRAWIFGGQSDGIFTNELWQYDKVSSNWSPLGGIAPSARDHASLVYDPNGRLWLFGGRAPDGTVLNDLWWFDPTNNEWGEVTPVGGPEPRMGQSMVLVTDGSTKQIVLFGGYDPQTDRLFDDTWIYEFGVGWVEETDSAAIPASAYHQAVYDPINGTIVVVIDGQTWIYSGGTQ